MPRIVDRYILREILPPFALALLVFTFMLMMQPIDRNAQDLLEKGVSLAVLARMLALLVPQALAVTIPMALLMGLLVAFGRLSADSEWVALQACGVALWRLLRPVLVLALVAWAGTQWVLVDLVPRCNQAFRIMEYRVVAARVESEIKPRVFFQEFPDLVLYVRGTAADGRGWDDVFVADTGKGPAPQVSVARSGRIVLDQVGRSVQLVLQDRVSYTMSTDAAHRAVFEASPSRELVTEIDPNRVFPQVVPVKGEPEKTIPELRKSIEDLRKQGLPTDRPEYYIHLKFSIPVACFVFALMGLGFGVSTHRGGKLAAFALGTGVIFAYYLVMYQARSLSLGGRFPAWLAAWLPNLVLGPIGALAVWRRGRSTGGLLLGRAGAVLGGLVQSWRPPRTVAAAPGGNTGAVIAARRGGRRFSAFSLWQPGILDRYIVTTHLRIQALTFVSLLGVFYISEFIDLSDRLFRGTASAGLLLRYFALETPQLVYYILPISVLLATLVTVGVLTRSSELVVMRACGVSLYRAALPLLAVAAVSSVLMFGLEEYVLASTNRRASDLDHQIRFGSARAVAMLGRQWTAARNGDIYHYQFFDPGHGELRNFWRYEFSRQDWRIARITYAEVARVAPASTDANSALATWTCRRGWVRSISPDGRADYSAFSTASIAMEPADYFGTEPPDASAMTFSELRGYIDSMRGAGLDVLPQLVDLYRKAAFPLVTIVMTLLAVPFAVMTGRRGALYGIGVGIVFAIVYWTASNVFGAVGAAGLLAPALAAWAPNLLFGAAAAYLLLTVRT
jgi:LPS export ABC transporter permease LptG/LPS export ABC transporter permease LptF